MNKAVQWIHRIWFWADVLLILASLVYYLIRWGSLPEEVGMHFSADGNFDVVASKFYGFYPHIISGLIIGGIAVADHLILTKQTGMRIDEAGERLFKTELLLTLDVFLTQWCVFFAQWSWAVSMQVPMDRKGFGVFDIVNTSLLLIGVFCMNLTCIRHRTEKKRMDTNVRHRLCRLVAWLLAAGNIGILAEVWERLPGDEALYGNPDYMGLAYFANVGAYLDKRWILAPEIVLIVLLLILEIIGVRAGKAQKSALVALTDKLKVICGLMFFWWEIMICSEEKIGVISVCFFLGACAVAFVLYVLALKRQKT